MGSEWTVKRIGEFAWDVNERAAGDGFEVLSVTKHAGFMASLEFFGKQVFSKDTSNYKVVRRGQFAYATIHLDEGSVDCLKIRDAGMISPMYTVFDVDETVVDRRFMLELLKSPGMLQRYEAIGAGSVNRRRSISFEVLAAEALHVPPLAEQKKIAQILSSVDEAIQATQAVIDQTRRVKEAMLQTLLTRGLGHTRFQQTEIGEIPEGWEVLTLNDLAEIRRGASPRPISDPKWFADNGPGWVRISDVTASRRYLRQTKQTLSAMGVSKSVAVVPGDLIMSICASIGIPVVVDMHACIHDGFVVFKQLSPRIRTEFLRYFIEWKTAEFEGRGQPGTQKNINTEIVKITPIAVPPIAEQDQIVSALNDVDELAQNNDSVKAALSIAKSALLQTLLSGQTRVTP